MKEWKKPCMEVVVLDESDIVCTSPSANNGVTVEDLTVDDGNKPKEGIWN